MRLAFQLVIWLLVGMLAFDARGQSCTCVTIPGGFPAVTNTLEGCQLVNGSCPTFETWLEQSSKNCGGGTPTTPRVYTPHEICRMAAYYKDICEGGLPPLLECYCSHAYPPAYGGGMATPDCSSINDFITDCAKHVYGRELTTEEIKD